MRSVGGCGLGSTDRRSELLAGLLAATADPGADAAVLVVRSVPLALGSGSATCRCAGLDRHAKNAEIGLGLAGHQAASRTALVCAVEAEPNTPAEVLDVRLRDASVGAARAGGHAVEAVLDTAHQLVAIDVDRSRVPLEHLSNCHVVSFVVVGHVLHSRAWTRGRAAQRWADVWERGWREHDPDSIRVLYLEGAFWQQHPFREPEPG
jgi:hypothetical protein